MKKNIFLSSLDFRDTEKKKVRNLDEFLVSGIDERFCELADDFC